MKCRLVVKTHIKTNTKEYWIQYKAWGIWFNLKNIWDNTKIVFKDYADAKAYMAQYMNSDASDLVTSKVVNG